MAYDLDFERPLAEIEKRIAHLQRRGDRIRSEERAQVEELKRELQRRMGEIYSSLTPWQRVQVARYRERPYTNDYLKLVFEDYFEMRGDRRFADDRAIQGGLASLDGETVMVVGHQKGRDLREREECNFGMAHPEGYRKALRLFRYAERFRFPVITLIDTTGAYPGLGDEERGISQAIAENLMVMAALRTCIICVVIGEGGSGGALGIGVGDRVLMMENAIYTVAAPEAAASIIWRDNAYAPDAAQAMKITAPELLELGVVDGIIPEPLGGAHRDYEGAGSALKGALLTTLGDLRDLPIETLLDQRYQRFRRIGLQGVAEIAPVSSATSRP
ncbi:MAG TPA: acetyl-CoA carboxylase carboxyltransferase subunit alpha [Ktedonobacterales bacterium]|nr:acetyl-CoA carboxylase carboxyltransferase subunit alpha [Ktedonobacterales bacterium]